MIENSPSELLRGAKIFGWRPSESVMALGQVSCPLCSTLNQVAVDGEIVDVSDMDGGSAASKLSGTFSRKKKGKHFNCNDCGNRIKVVYRPN